MFNVLGFESNMMLTPTLEVGNSINFRTYSRMLRCANTLALQITELSHLQEQSMSVAAMKHAMETGNLTRYVIEAADPHGVFTTQLGIVPSTLSDIPLHPKDPRGQLFVKGLEALAAPTVGGAITDSVSGAITTLTEMFTHIQPCVADLSARVSSTAASVEAMTEGDRMRLNIHAPTADDLYTAMNTLASVELPMPSIADADVAALHNTIHAIGHYISLVVQGAGVVPVPAGAYPESLVGGIGSLDALGYTKTNMSGIVTKTKETLTTLTNMINQRNAILSRLVDLQGRSTTDQTALSCIIGWVSSYSEIMSGMVTYSADALSIVDAAVNGDGVEMPPQGDDSNNDADLNAVPKPAVAPSTSRTTMEHNLSNDDAHYSFRW